MDDIEAALNQLDENIAFNSAPSSTLLDFCFSIFVKVSKVPNDESEASDEIEEHDVLKSTLFLYRQAAEIIVKILKELSTNVSMKEDGFLRDTFLVKSVERNAQYWVLATEYYSPVQYYHNSNNMMKLIQWLVYKLPSTFVNFNDEDVEKMELFAQYNLERSQRVDGTPTYVFGRTDFDDFGHVSLVNYGRIPGPIVDGYYEMKLLVIKDLKSSKGLPPLAQMVRNQKTGISTVFEYNLNEKHEYRRYPDHVSLESYNTPEIKIFGTKTGRKKNSDL